MSRFTLSVLGALVATALMAIASVGATTASAAFVLNTEKCSGGTNIDFCWTGEKETTNLRELVGTEEYEFLGTDSAAKLLSSLGGAEVEIECTTTAATEGVVEQPEPLAKNYKVKTLLTFSGCELKGTLGEKCKVPASEPTTKLLGTPKNAKEISFAPETGKVFIEINFEEKKGCPATVKGKKQVKGEQVCSFVNPGTDAEEIELGCAASKLELAEQAATYTTTLLLAFKNIKPDWSDISEEA